MALKFNPLTGNFDFTGSGGGGASYIDGEVAVYADLPLDGTAALNTAWLVRTASGVWPVTRHQAGIYIRTATGGSSRDADWTYAGTMPDVFSDANFTVYDDADTSKNLKFQLSGLTTGTTSTLTVPASGTIALTTTAPAAHAASHAAAGSDPVFNQDLNTTNDVEFNLITINGIIATSGIPGSSFPLNGEARVVDIASDFYADFAAIDNLTANRTYELPDASGTIALTTTAPASHAHGNLTNAGLVGTTSGLPLKTGAGGIVEAGAFGTAAGAFCEGNDARLSDARTPTSHTHPATAISDSTTAGRALLTGADAAAQRTSLGLGTLATQSGTFSGTSSGTNTGDQTITLTGDVTGSGTGSFAATIASNAVTNAKLAQVATSTLKGRATAATGNVEDLTAAQARTLLNVADGATANSTDAFLLGRANHTGTQAVGTITGLGGAATMSVGTTVGTVAAGDDSRLSDSRTPTAHVHGNITNDGKVGSTSGVPVVTTTNGAVTTLALGTANQVLRVNSGATGVEFGTVSGGVTGVDATTTDVFSVSGVNLVADASAQIDSSDPFVQYNTTSGKLVYANPLRRTATGSFYVGLAPTSTSIGSDAINIQSRRTAATRVASGQYAINIGDGTASARGTIVIDGEGGAVANSNNAIAIGSITQSTGGSATIAIGNQVIASGSSSIAIGTYATTSSGAQSMAIGREVYATATNSVGVGYSMTVSGVNATAVGVAVNASLYGQFATRPFLAVTWSGQTTTATPAILNLEGVATNRFTIAATTALAVDILLVARRATTQDKWLVARRFLGIRRDASNNTSLIGTVQTLGTDQSTGSPTWTFALTADDTNEALQLEVTGAASETVEWRATAFYRVA